MPIEIVSGNQGVLIQPNGDGFYSMLFINCRNGVQGPEAQVIKGKTHSTEAGARRWAAKQLAT